MQNDLTFFTNEPGSTLLDRFKRTAFPADENYPEKIRQERGLMEIKKPQS